MEYVIIALGIAFVLYKIYTTFKYGQSIFDCYVAAYLPLIIFVLVGSIFPAFRGNENLGYFLVYIPMFALFILPFTMFPVIIAHIIYKIKFRNQQKSNERVIHTAIPFVTGLVLTFGSAGVTFIGFLLTTGVCIYRIMRSKH